MRISLAFYGIMSCIAIIFMYFILFRFLPKVQSDQLKANVAMIKSVQKYNDAIISSEEKNILKKYPGYKVSIVNYPTFANGQESFEFNLIKDHKVKGHVYIDQKGKITDDLVQNRKG